MEQLVKLVQEKTGLSREKSRQAVEVVVSYLKKQLPAPIAGQVDAVLANESVMDKAGDALKGGLGGLLGGDKS